MSARAPVVAEPQQAPAQANVEPARTCACGGKAEADGECSKCRSRRMVQRSAFGPAPRAVPGIVRQVATAPGRPLDIAVRGEMEGRFGHDFSRVRVHSDGLAHQAARSVNALAFTYGDAIAFGPGVYSPETAAGRRLIAHELAHVIQQSRGPGGATETALEAEAARAGQAVEDSSPIRVASASPTGIQRQDAESAVAEYEAQLSDPAVHGAPPGYSWYLLITPRLTSMPSADMARRQLADVVGAEAIEASTVKFGGKLGEHAWWSFTHPIRGEIGRVIGKFSEAAAPGEASTRVFTVYLVYKLPPITGKQGDKDSGGGTAKEGKPPEEGKKEEQPRPPEGGLTEEQQKKPGSGTLAGAIERGKQLEKEMASPVKPDLTVLKDPNVAAFLLQILEHFSARPISPADETAARDGLSEDEVNALAGTNPLRRSLVALYTQGYAEFKAAGGTDFEQFKLLIQTIDEQFTRGNPTAALNRLKIGYGFPEKEVLGIVERPTGIILYDNFGIPLPSFGGGGLMRDHGYIGSRNQSEFGINISTIEDVAVRQLLNALRQSFGDPTRMVIEAANIYYENIERVNAEVRNGLGEEILKKFEEMIVPFIGFIAGHAVSSFLLRYPHPQVAAVGLALKGLLTAAGYVFDIQFAAEALTRLMQASAELIKVEKNEKGQLTKLSEDHIKNAAKPIQQMVADIALMAGMHALGGLLRLAAKGLSKLQIKCTTCKLDEIVAKEEGKAKENIPPEKPKVEVDPRVRGFAVEDVHLDSIGYQSLRKLPVEAIDGIKGGDVEFIPQGGQIIKRYTRPDAVSVKSTNVTDPVALTRKVRADLAPLRGRYQYKRGDIEINGLRERRLDLIFEEGSYSKFTKETLSTLEAMKTEAGSVVFRWYIYVAGKKFFGPEFLKAQSKMLEDL